MPPQWVSTEMVVDCFGVYELILAIPQRTHITYYTHKFYRDHE
jgi:hypothetical protein